MKIDKPIFIIGSGRSGTTVLYDLLSLHPELCWFSNLSDKFPQLPQISFAHRILDMPFIGNTFKQKIVKAKSKFKIRPNEAGNIHHHYCGFRDDIRTTEEDYNEQMAQKFKSIIEAHLKYTGKKRFLSKQTTNNQRIRLVNKMFPDAYYIHIVRDGRAVANSLLHVDFWNDIIIWWLGYKPPQWEAMGKEPIELCALQWQRDIEEILQNRHLFEERYMELKYEDFVKDVRGTMAQITDFCQLNPSKAFEEILPHSLPSMNDKWKKLPEQQKTVLQQTTSGLLNQLGYIT